METSQPLMQPTTGQPPHLSISRFTQKPIIFWILALALVAGGVLRSNWATRLDGFTLDEAYHIMAGASYAKTGSFRINPEHPPLTKLWVGEVVLLNGYKLAPFKPLNDKRDERKFAEEDVYLKNNPVAVQQQGRWAMFALNGLLLLLFTVMLRRLLSAPVALLTLAYLIIDPTVAAHLPVVMTDLPVALASGAAMLAALLAFRSWRAVDLFIAAGCLGLALAAKHSAIITAVGVGILGIIMATVGRDNPSKQMWTGRMQRLGLVSLVLVGAVVVLWAFYGFRYRDSPETGEFFNRPLATKIDDIRSPTSRILLNGLANAHLLPASYIWGLADTFRAGVEGRAGSFFAFGKAYLERAPIYYAPGIWAVKLPIGLLLLTLTGLVLLVLRRLPQSSLGPLAGLGLLAALFWLALATGSTYGGVRHALALLPFLALLGALAVLTAWESGQLWLRVGVGLAGVAGLVTALSVVRPWEYFNELVGGSANSYHYFSDEGVDLCQRSGELIQYYKKYVGPTGEIPFIFYGIRRAEKERYKMHWIGENPEKDSSRFQSSYVSGTFFMPTTALSPNLYDKEDQVAVFRKAKPIARMGNLLVYKGRFYLPYNRAYWLVGKGYKALYGPGKIDSTEAVRYLAAGAALYPQAFGVNWDLGNLYVRRNARQKAIQAFEKARLYCLDSTLTRILTSHISRVKTDDLRRIPTLRNPGTE